MNYSNFRLYMPVKNLVISPIGVEGKNVVFGYISENIDFFNGIRLLNIKPNFIRWIFVPSMKRPINYIMSSQSRDEIISMGLKPIRGFFKDINSIEPRNMYINFDSYLNMLIKRFGIKNFNSLRGDFIINTHLGEINNLDSNEYEKVLMYTIDADSINDGKMFDKKIFPIYKMLVTSKNRQIKFPYDKILVYKYSKIKGGQFILVFDKNKKFDLTRIKNIFFKRKSEENIEDSNENTEEEDLIKEDVMIEYLSNLL